MGASFGSMLNQSPLLAAPDKGVSAPRIGLIIGNSQYHESPLSNPGNDARAMSVELSMLGFEVQTLVDANLSDLRAAITQYSARLAKTKAVGLFYYAGHGVQLGWRNYLVPVDANIDHVDDIPKQTLDLNIMLSALGKAENPMNIIIIDACRDNPFGRRLPVEQKGLSQIDAPTGSLLCYSTAPGNVASDGEAGNGLYTENLLREMRNPEAKIEDVLKRVRLSVRLKSNGLQIPWESSSLEGDFYFNAAAVDPNYIAAKLAENATAAKMGSAGSVLQGLEPSQAPKVSDVKNKALPESEVARRFSEESALWVEASKSNDLKLVEQFIRTYPNGSFSELAQARLDQLLKQQGEKRVEIVSSANNPYTRGSASGIGRYMIGDRYDFRVTDIISGIKVRDLNEKVSQVSDSEIVFNDGDRIIDLMGNELKSPQPRYLSPAQQYCTEYSVGREWSSKYGWKMSGGKPSIAELKFRVIGREMITTPAGTFNAFVVSANGYIVNGGKLEIKYWIDPEKCNRPVRYEFLNRKRNGMISRDSETTELIAFSEKRLG